MSKTVESKSVADQMVSDLGRIANSLDELKVKGLPMAVIFAYLQKRTHLPQKDIRAVLDGLAELSREFKAR